ncbi:hypothetical protein Pen01_21490 [Phytomonospora endophytica]|nr:hypothetical protein Pen01_21490 [Phytomonospora endophytica]
MVSVVEKGFSEGDHGGQPTVSYGVVVENTGGGTAYLTGISIRLLDAAGKPIGEVGGGAERTRDIGVILPGHRAGIGYGAFLERAGVASIEVTVLGTQWTPLGDGTTRPAELTATWRSSERDDDDDLTVTFTVDSAYPAPIDGVTAEAVLRDAAGAVVGGTGPASSRLTTVAPGESTGSIKETGPLPSDVDDARTEIHLYPRRLL